MDTTYTCENCGEQHPNEFMLLCPACIEEDAETINPDEPGLQDLIDSDQIDMVSGQRLRNAKRVYA
jgi:hypothetical protein